MCQAIKENIKQLLKIVNTVIWLQTICTLKFAVFSYANLGAINVAFQY